MDRKSSSSSSTNEITSSDKVAVPPYSYTDKIFSFSWASQETPPREKEAEKPIQEKSGLGEGIISDGMEMMTQVLEMIPGFQNNVQQEEENKELLADDTRGSFFSYSSLGLDLTSLAGSLYEAKSEAKDEDTEEEIIENEKDEKEEDAEETEDWSTYFSNAIHQVGQIGTDLSNAIQDTVNSVPLISELDKEQKEFIRSKENI